MTRFQIGDDEYEVGQILNLEIAPNGPGTEPSYLIPSRIIAVDPVNGRIEFETLGEYPLSDGR